jgi:hypothetical protein
VATSGAARGERGEDRLRRLDLAIPLGLVVAFAIARGLAHEADRRPSCWRRALERRACLVTGLIAALVAGYAGRMLDFGVSDLRSSSAEPPSATVEAALIAMVAIAAGLVATSMTLRRRRREIERAGQ